MAPPARQMKSPGWAVTTSPVFCSAIDRSLPFPPPLFKLGRVPGGQAPLYRAAIRIFDERRHHAAYRHRRLSAHFAAQARANHLADLEVGLRRRETHAQGVQADGAG